MKKFTLLFLLFSMMLAAGEASAQALVSWTTFPSSAWNATWPATSVASNVTVSAFSKGTGISGSGTPAGSSWGGSGGWGNASSNTLAGTLYFTIKANNGYKLSFSSIPFFYSRRSNSGPTGAAVMYSLDGGATYTTIATVTTSSTSSGGTNNPINTLSSDANLQNIPSTKTVTFKIVPNSSTANWYINSGGIQFDGTVTSEPLPVTLMSFTGTNRNGDVKLDWLTASETNNSHFEIERSVDGKRYNPIASVASENSAQGAAYSYTDKYIDVIAYYRLKTIDKDGSYAYSKIIKVGANEATEKGFTITLSNNPVMDRLQFTYSQGAQNGLYNIVNMAGVTLSKGVVEPQDDIAEINVKGLPAGLYVLHLYNGNQEYSAKFLKQ